jgi:serine/threonine-protein kinase HipA
MQLKVSLDFGHLIHEVGTLVYERERYFFKYSDTFLSSGLEISPLKLPLTAQVQTGPGHVFEGLFGVFNDSLPDGWGRLLIDRSFIEAGKAPSSITALERLAKVGNNGIGAIIYEPSYEIETPNFYADLDAYDKEAEQLLKEGQSAALDELAALGGNSVGARPKVHVYYSDLGALLHAKPQAHTIPYIIKFRSQQDLLDASKIEFLYYQMALDAGIEMSASRLFYGAQDRCYFGTERFDQGPGWRKHFHSVSGLLHDNFRLSTLDYGHIMDLANRLENNLDAAQKVFRLAVFNLYAQNADDHTKNFGFLMDATGNWIFSPAYDLTFSPAPNNCHHLSFAGTYQNPGKTELLKLAAHFNIKEPEQIITQVKDTLTNFSNYAKFLDIRKTERHLVEKSIQKGLGA